MRKYAPIYATRREPVEEDFDVDRLLFEIERDVDQIMHDTYMEKLDAPRGNSNEKVRESKGRIFSVGSKRETMRSSDVSGGFAGKFPSQIESIYENSVKTARYSDDEGEEVTLSHESDVVNAQESIDRLMSQMTDIRQKLASVNEIERQLLEAKRTVASLEEENAELNANIEEAVIAIKNNQSDESSSKSIGFVLRNQNPQQPSSDNSKKNPAEFLVGEDFEDDAGLIGDENTGGRLLNFFRMIWNFIERKFPLKKEIVDIHSKFGATMSAYFSFKRWIIFLYFIISIVMCVFLVYHIGYMLSSGMGNQILASPPAGLLPMFMRFSTFSVAENLNYTIMVTLGIFLFLFNVFRKYLKEDAITKQINFTEGENYSKSYGKDIFVAWDNHLSSAQEIHDFSSALMQLYMDKVFDTEHAGLIKAMTQYELALIYLRRFFCFSVYLAIQTIFYAAIITVTIYTDTIVEMVPSLSALSGSIPSITVSIVDALTPIFWSILTDLENWDRFNKLNVYLSRMFFSLIFNVAILGMAFVFLADPYLLADNSSSHIRAPISQSFDPLLYPCRMDQVQNGLFQLIITDWVTKNISVFIAGIIPVVSAWIFKSEVVKPEFNLPTAMMGNVNTSALVFMCLPFSPLSLIFSPILLSLSTKWEAFVYLRYYSKPSNPIQAQKAGLIFTRLYLLTILIIGIPSTLYFLNTYTFPKNCDIQDSAINICSSPPVNDVCAVNNASAYYSGNSTICSPYPACICSGTLACGPFIGNQNAVRPLRDLITHFRPLKWLWVIFLGTSYGAWFLLFPILLFASLRKNTITVSRDHYVEHEKLLESQIKALEIVKKKQLRQIARYKLAQEDHEEI